MRSIATLFLLIFSLYLVGCNTRYRIIQSSTVDKRRYVKTTSDYKWLRLDEYTHIIVNDWENRYEIYDVHYHRDSNVVSGRYKELDEFLWEQYTYAKFSNRNVVKMDRDASNNDVRQMIFMTDSMYTAGDQLFLPLNHVSSVDVLKPGLHPLATAGIVTGSIIVGGAALLLILCNCPYVYMDNGDGLVLENTLFTGAKAQQLERYDYKILPDYFKDSNWLALNIVNKLEEDQYTNDLDLINVMHPADLKVVMDQDGVIHTITDPIAPTKAYNEENTDLFPLVAHVDDAPYGFDPEGVEELTNLYLEFDNNAHNEEGKLVLRLRNSQWSGFVYDQFNALFGENHSKWVEMNKDKTKEDREKWMREQGIKLIVERQTDEGWETVNEVELLGEVSFNEIVIPVKDLDKDKNTLRLRTGFKFWDIDYAAMDYSVDSDLIQVQTIAPTSAIDNFGVDHTEAILENDALYMSHEQDSSTTRVLFEDLTTSTELERTLIVRSKGYYHMKKEYTGKTQRKKLKNFVNPGELSRFSKELFDRYSEYLSEN